jgi:hypothetical protein
MMFSSKLHQLGGSSNNNNCNVKTKVTKEIYGHSPKLDFEFVVVGSIQKMGNCTR